MVWHVTRRGVARISVRECNKVFQLRNKVFQLGWVGSLLLLLLLLYNLHSRRVALSRCGQKQEQVGERGRRVDGG